MTRKLWTGARVPASVADNTSGLYYRGNKISKAIYRGNTVWDAASRIKPEPEPESDSFDIVWDEATTPLWKLITAQYQGITGDNVTVINNGPYEDTNFVWYTIKATRFTNISLSSYTTRDGSHFTTPALQAILTPFPKNASGITRFSESFVTSKIKSVPTGLFDACPNVVSFNGCFGACRELESLPDGLFNSCTKAENFTECFEQCKKLSDIPSDLFAFCSEARTFDGCFADCHSITYIPAHLFDSCTKTTSFYRCFDACTNLTTIPSHLFDHCKDVTTFENCFRLCKLAYIPSGLFDNCEKVTSFSGCFDANHDISSIPDGLFRSCTEVMNFYMCFCQCYNLEYVPSDLFSNCSKVERFRSCFESCRSIVSNVPRLWERYGSSADLSSRCFRGCTNAANYSEIPDAWK